MRTELFHGPAFELGDLVLVNGTFPCPPGLPQEPLVPVHSADGGILMTRRAAAMLNALMEELGGWADIVPVSGWRSQAEQRAIWDDSMAENGEEFTRKFVARPGHSEHQTGLAIDLGLRGEEVDFIRPEFPYEGICQAFRARMARYGFIQRYPAGKERVTGIAHEPWHFRYVGTPHAQLMTERGLTLEEYHVLLGEAGA